ncbi:unnamed protein product [Rotaria magnacalcarata]|uniref:Uncharacterized protein n=2 Tax=Rotaria magnacalcarata TaxID=392030 RepID=A0A8S2RUY0_9BILA|nr:unnamed protein product [Rotaria magnacalcarata]
MLGTLNTSTEDLPALITAVNILIAVTLHRVSHTPFDWFVADEKIDLRSSTMNVMDEKFLSNVYPLRSSKSSSVIADTSQATKRRTSAQVTRMLLAVTLSLIILNIPNTIMSLFSRIIDRKLLLHGRLYTYDRDSDITSYKINFYISVLRDVLLDFLHIVNCFLYYSAGRKFRSIFINEIRNCLIELHLMERTERHFTRNGSIVNPAVSNTIYMNSRQI